MPELAVPAVHLHASWLEAHAEWGPGLHEDGFGLLAADDVDSFAGFQTWVDRLSADASRCTYRWIIDGNQVLGGIAMRHAAHEDVERAGHIGFGIRPSARRRGLAGWALNRMLAEAKVLGLEAVLLVCAAETLHLRERLRARAGFPQDGQPRRTPLCGDTPFGFSEAAPPPNPSLEFGSSSHRQKA